MIAKRMIFLLPPTFSPNEEESNDDRREKKSQTAKEKHFLNGNITWGKNYCDIP